MVCFCAISACVSVRNHLPDPPTWHKVEAGAFSLFAPPGWEFHQLQGVDSYVGEFTGDGVTLKFDYGQYSSPLNQAVEPKYVIAQQDIGGHTAKVVYPRSPGHGVTGIYFSKITRTDKLCLWGQDLSDSQQELALQIFRTIRFPTRIEGTYRNPALGYSIRIPRGLKASASDEAGPERGVRITLPSGGEIVVFGEPNSLEWKNPEEGVKLGKTRTDCTTDRQQVKQVKIGQLKGAETSVVCGDRVLTVLLAFRKGGGPIYWIRLETLRSHQVEDEAILNSVAASLKQIPWE
jgi:hypothetical protein